MLGECGRFECRLVRGEIVVLQAIDLVRFFAIRNVFPFLAPSTKNVDSLRLGFR